jgi:hypothetical protein
VCPAIRMHSVSRRTACDAMTERNACVERCSRQRLGISKTRWGGRPSGGREVNSGRPDARVDDARFPTTAERRGRKRSVGGRDCRLQRSANLCSLRARSSSWQRWESGCHCSRTVGRWLECSQYPADDGWGARKTIRWLWRSLTFDKHAAMPKLRLVPRKSN